MSRDLDGGRYDSRWHRYAVSIRSNVPFAPLLVYNALLWCVLPRRRFFEHADVPGSEVLEANFATIREELAPLLADRSVLPAFQEFDPGQARLSHDALWKVFILRGFGVDAPDNRERCPRTAAVIDQVPGLYTAMFSILEPGKRIPVHAGPIKGLIRYHLPLVVPAAPDCKIKIGGVVTGWEEGRAILFDDTFLHSAWNETDEVRVVLFVDLERPMPWAWLTSVNRRVLALLTRTDRVRGAVARADGFDRAALDAAGI